MKQTFTNCKPTICENTLMSEDWIFMTKDIIKEQCNCVYTTTCMLIINLLNANKTDEAKPLIDYINKNEM
jgi:hypothetical protein